MKKSKPNLECGKRFRAIRKLAADFAYRSDFGTTDVKALKEMKYSCGDDFVCAVATFPAGPAAQNRIHTAHILSALVYASALSVERVGFTFNDFETMEVNGGKEVLVNFNLGFYIVEAK